MLIILNLLDILTPSYSSFFSFIGVIPSIESFIENRNLRRESILLKNLYFCFVAQIFDNPYLRNNANKIDQPRYSKSNTSLTTALNSSVKVSIKSFNFGEATSFQKKLLRGLIQNSDNPKKIGKRAFKIESSRYPNAIVFDIRSLYYFRQGLNRKPNTYRGSLFEKRSISFFASNCKSKKSQLFQFSFTSMFKLIFLRYFRLDIFSQSSSLNRQIFAVQEFWVQKVIDFVLCVGSLILRKCQRTAVYFDTFPIFQITFLPICWLYFILQCYILKHFVLIRFPVMKFSDMFIVLESY